MTLGDGRIKVSTMRVMYCVHAVYLWLMYRPWNHELEWNGNGSRSVRSCDQRHGGDAIHLSSAA